ncbi:TRAP transporter large permease subunit [Geminicoccaceae bacterium 1502E]|nr:TRAP transporter large permease subunit [Geminicoccaceae bacterium 1502E]
MGIELISVLLLAGLLFLLACGVPMAFATGTLGVALAYLNFGIPGLGILMQRIYSLTTEYVLVSVPMFILMASLMERSGIARDMYDALKVWTGRITGGVAVVTTVMAILMAAMSGIIGGEIVLLGLVALPQMLRLGYNQNLAMGTICAGGSLGTMIPPSIVLIVYGLVAEVSISGLFVAAVIPGLMMGGLYIAYIMIRCRIDPSLAPRELDLAEMGLVERLRHSGGIVPPILLATVVLGSIYGGVTSITEAAGMGVVGTLLIVALRRELTLAMFIEALTQTFRSVGTLLWVTFGASALIGAYSLAGGPAYASQLITGLDVPPLAIIALMMLVFLVLGMFMDWIGIVLLCMPVFVPIIKALGYDPIWFGVLFCINMQVSFLSPPFGPAAFYLKSVAPPHITLVDIYRSFGPFVGLQLVVLLLVLLFPGLALVLL